MNERKLRSIYDVQTLLKELKMFASTRCLFCKPLDICHVALILFGACRLVPYRIPIDREEQRQSKIPNTVWLSSSFKICLFENMLLWWLLCDSQLYKQEHNYISFFVLRMYHPTIGHEALLRVIEVYWVIEKQSQEMVFGNLLIFM